MFWGSRPLSMGTASVGYANDNNALQINPAGIAQPDWFSIDLNYQRKEFETKDFPWYASNNNQTSAPRNPLEPPMFKPKGTASKPKTTVDTWHISLVDHKTVKVIGAGVYFNGDNFPSQAANENSGYEVGLGIAGDIADMIYIGGAGKYFQPESNKSGFDLDLGFLINPAEFIGIGIAGRNIIPVERELQEWYPTDVALGIAGKISKYAVIDLDVTKRFNNVKKVFNSDNTFNFALGAEGTVKSHLGLRGGAYFDLIEKRNFYSFGIGWMAKEGSISAAFLDDFANYKNFDLSVQVGLTF